MKNKKIILCILDGFAFGDLNTKHRNAYRSAKKPNFEKILEKYPCSFLEASGHFVGLPDGQMGNSEVGHLTIGSGRTFEQSLNKIERLLKSDHLFNEEEIKKINNSKNIHLIGMLSRGGVHSSLDHFVEICKKFKYKNIFIHAFTDGRDCGIEDSLKDFAYFEEKIKEIGANVKISSICGRFYAMDRDLRWEKIEPSFNNIFNPTVFYNSWEDGIKKSHSEGITDEFIKPFATKEFEKPNIDDSIILTNFRPDRVKQIATAITDPSFKSFERNFGIDNKKVFFMTDFFVDDCKTANNLGITVLLKKTDLKNIIGEIISKKGLGQTRIAESEKYAHVTFFFNGQLEKPFENEKRIIVHSPKVESYADKPEMSIYEVCPLVLKEIQANQDLVVLNIANCDIVGHTGNFEAAVKAVEHVDNVIGQILKEVEKNDYVMIITADHGNIDDMGEEGEIHTSHTTSKVPFILINYTKDSRLTDGDLADIAPTILDIYRFEKPTEMTGKSLII